MLRLSALTALCGSLLCVQPLMAADIDAATYGYPLDNPFEATIATTPPELRPALPTDDQINQADYALELRPKRAERLPDNFWPVKQLHYRLAKQKGPAPLVFIIAGTGGNYASSLAEYLKRLFYGAGYHVAQLSSPTSYDFITAASRSATPGISTEDAEDLYHVMEVIKAQQSDLPVTDYFLTGYSLGGLNAAFVSKLDESRQVFNFKRVLMLNPPVNLYTSITNLDRLVQTEVKGINNNTTFYELVMGKLTRYFQQKGYIDLNDALLYDFQESKMRLSKEQMAMLIGSSFRFSSADIAFTSDLINKRGLITPPNYPISESTNLTPFFKRALQCDFGCYMSEQLIPYWRKHFDGGSQAQLIRQVSLFALEDYLKNSSKIAAMHNADDLILGPDDLGFLRRTMGERLTVYPHGGHCGNLNYRVNSDAMLEFFRG